MCCPALNRQRERESKRFCDFVTEGLFLETSPTRGFPGPRELSDRAQYCDPGVKVCRSSEDLRSAPYRCTVYSQVGSTRLELRSLSVSWSDSSLGSAFKSKKIHRIAIDNKSPHFPQLATLEELLNCPEISPSGSTQVEQHNDPTLSAFLINEILLRGR